MIEILQVELDLNSMQAAWLRIASKIPHHTKTGSFVIELAFTDAYALPAFTVVRSSDNWNEGIIYPARFKVLNSKWVVIDTGEYNNDIDAMTEALIGVFGGVK